MSNWGAWEWIIFAASALAWWLLLELVGKYVSRRRRDRRLREAAKHAPDGALLSKHGTVWTYWMQVGALEFRRYLENDQGRIELERVVYEDTPGGRLAARDFRAGHNVTGPMVLHTRERKG